MVAEFTRLTVTFLNHNCDQLMVRLGQKRVHVKHEPFSVMG